MKIVKFRLMMTYALESHDMRPMSRFSTRVMKLEQVFDIFQNMSKFYIYSTFGSCIKKGVKEQGTCQADLQ